MTLQIGVIGAGAAARLHAHAYMSAGSRTRLIAVADDDVARARKMRDAFGFEHALHDYHDLLARRDIDAVSVCTPAASHARIVLDAIRAGKHVLCEKPMATTAEDAQAIVATSEHSDRCISCVFQHRDDPALRRARWLLEERALGNVLAARLSARTYRDAAYYANGRGTLATDGGGALMVQGIHLLDALIWLAGPIASVSATMDRFVHPFDTEDTLSGWARLVTGAVATIDCTTCAQRDQYSVEVRGETAALRVDYRPGWARTWKLRVESRRKRAAWDMWCKAEQRFPPERRFRAGSVAAIAVRRALGKDGIATHLGHGPHVRRYLEAIESGGSPPVPPADAARSVEAVLAFYLSARQGEPVSIAPSKT